MSPSLAQSLPEDIIYEIFYATALIDPPRYAGPPDLPERMPVRPSQSDLNLDLYPLWTGIRGPYWHAELETIRRRSLFSHTGSLGWIGLTHVCRSWREVGIDIAPLWGEVVHVFPSALETTFARSRSAPLCLDFGALRRLPVLKQMSLHDQFYMLLTQNIQRARSLVACNPFRSFRDWHGILLRHELPLLEDLTLNGAKRIPELIGSPLTPLLAPSLTRLVLDQTAFMPFSAPSLRALFIQGAHPSVPPTALLAALSTTPQLEKLELMFSLDDEHPAPDDTPPVHLPNLSSARLCDSPESLSIWRHVVAPLNVELRLHAFRETIFQGPAMNSLNQLFSAILPHTSAPAINAFSIVYDAPYRTFVVAFGTCSASADPAATLPANRVTMRLLFRDIIIEFGTFPAFLSRLVQEMAPSNIQLMHVSPFPSVEDVFDLDLFNIGNLASVLQAFTRLRVMSLGQERERGQPFLVALGRRNETGSAILPSLRTLVFATPDENDGSVDNGRMIMSDKRWDDLAGLLSQRVDAGHKLPRLVLRGEKSVRQIQWGDLTGMESVRVLVDELVDERNWILNP